MSSRKADLKPRLRAATGEEWAQLLKHTPGDYALSQTFGFGAALGRAYPEYSHEPLIAHFEDGARVGLPLVRVQSRLFRVFEAMPLSLQGMPIGVNATPTHLRAAVQAINADRLALSAGAKALEGAPDEIPREFDFDGESSEGETHVLDLGEGFEALWTGKFSSQARNRCRAAIKRGVECFEATTPGEFDLYYEIYTESTQRWGYAAPPYPRALFRELSTLLRASPEQSGVQLKLARVEEQIVAGVLLFHGKRSTLYWSGAMKREFSACSPNNALFHAVISEVCDGERQIFDFGSSGPLDSVRRFKENFGARPVRFWNFSRVSARYKLAQDARQKLRRKRVEEVAA